MIESHAAIAGDTVHDARTDEIGPRASEAAADADDADGLATSCQSPPLMRTL